MATATQHLDAEIQPAIDNTQPATAGHQHPAPSPSFLGTLDLDAIIERSSYTRTLRPDHVEHLAASIAAIGLEQPLVLITGNQLVAGRHRYHALLSLRDRDPDLFERLFPTGEVPVNVFDLGEQPDPERILALELTENSARQNYTEQEVASAVEALKAGGYSCKRGRPGKGERPIGPVLRRMFGMSEATMHRALSAARRGEKLSDESVSSSGDKPGRRKIAAEKLSRESVSGAREEAQPAAQDRLGDARSAVEHLNDDQFAEFVAWFTAHHRQRLG